MGTVKVFTTGKYPRQSATTYVSLNSGNFPSFVKIKSGFMKDVSSAKTSKSFAADKNTGRSLL